MTYRSGRTETNDSEGGACWGASLRQVPPAITRRAIMLTNEGSVVLANEAGDNKSHGFGLRSWMMETEMLMGRFRLAVVACAVVVATTAVATGDCRRDRTGTRPGAIQVEASQRPCIKSLVKPRCSITERVGFTERAVVSHFKYTSCRRKSLGSMTL